MIKYRLLCDDDHEFEGWFRNSADYDRQAERGLIECPVCGAGEVRKAVMAPAIARGRGGDRLSEIRRDIARAAERARDYVQENFDYVGEKFPEEARKIHYGEAEERGIYGEASGKDVRELITEGVEVAPMPGASKPAKQAGKERAAKKTGQSAKKLN